MVPRENANSEQPVWTSIRFREGPEMYIWILFFEHVRRRSRDNISGVQDRPAHPLLLTNSPRWSTACVVPEAGGLTHVEACFLVAVLVTSLVTQELIRSLGGSGSASVQTLGMIPRTVQTQTHRKRPLRRVRELVRLLAANVFAHVRMIKLFSARE